MNQKSNAIESYSELTIEIPNQQVELVCDFIINNITNGIVLEDEEGSNITLIKFYVPEETETSSIALIKDFFNGHKSDFELVPEINKSLIKNVAWEEEYKKSVKPVWIGNDIVVYPTWDKTEFKAQHKIIIEPKMAFGTGTHETTRSCLKVIYNNFQSGSNFLDLGCGSGILSILAGKMGASFIKAVDYDILSTENTEENFIINQIKTPNEIIHGSIEKCIDDKPYDFVCANIIRKTILEMLDQLNKLTRQNGILVLSGLLEQDENVIREALAKLNLNKIESVPDNEWRTLIIKKA